MIEHAKIPRKQYVDPAWISFRERKEIAKILINSDDCRSFVLATILSTYGSSVRKAGARMLISSQGQSSYTGSVSGGCLEQAVVSDALKTLNSGNHVVKTFSTGGADDDFFGSSIGCEGQLTVLLELLPKQPKSSDLYLYTGLSPTSLTLRTSNSEQINHQSGRSLVSWLGVREDNGHAAVTRGLGDPEIGDYDYLLIEKLTPPPSIVVFGCQDIGLAIIAFAQQLGWDVWAVDHRPNLLSRVRSQFPDTKIWSGRPDNCSFQRDLPPGSAFVICTHNILLDAIILQKAAAANPYYIGLVGSQKRKANLLEQPEIRAILANLGDLLVSPAGGASNRYTPEAIAFAIIAEITNRQEATSAHAYQRPELNAIILAAGRSRRLGSPKQLLTTHCETLLERQIRFCQSALGPNAKIIVMLADDLPAPKISSATPEVRLVPTTANGGIGETIANAIGLVPATSTGLLLSLIDQPLIPLNHYHDLVAEFRRHCDRIIATRADYIGVPAIFPRSFFGDLEMLRGDQGAKHLIHANNPITVVCTAANHDIDYVADLDDLQAPHLAQ